MSGFPAPRVSPNRLETSRTIEVRREPEPAFPVRMVRFYWRWLDWQYRADISAASGRHRE